MPRHARLVLPDTPHHVVQRGHNRQTVFVSDDDYRYYLDNLHEWKEVFGCRIYAWCLMTNHIHLIVDPGEDVESLGRLMKRLAGRQTRFVNRVERRSGTLWEGRFKSSPIDTDNYLLACCRYVERNPVKGGLVTDPADYPWSSCAAHLGQAPLNGLDLDPCYLALGNDPATRQRRYRSFLHDAAEEEKDKIIHEAVRRGQLTGNRRFVDEIEARLERRIELRGPGRPRKVGE